MRLIALITLSAMLAGCSDNPKAPKAVDWSTGARTPEEAAQALKEAERRQPCSAENLKNASEEQKRRCDPMRGMFGNVRPVAPAATNTNKQH